MIKYFILNKEISQEQCIYALVNSRYEELQEEYEGDLDREDFLEAMQIGLQDDIMSLVILNNTQHTTEGYRIESDLNKLDLNLVLLQLVIKQLGDL